MKTSIMDKDINRIKVVLAEKKISLAFSGLN